MATSKENTTVKSSKNNSMSEHNSKQSDDNKKVKKTKPDSSDKELKTDAENNNQSETNDNIVTTQKELPTSEILKERSPEVEFLKNEVAEYEELKSKTIAEIDRIKNLLKPIPRAERKLLHQSGDAVTKEERKAARVQLSHLDQQLVWINEQIGMKYSRLSLLSKNVSRRINIEKLRERSLSTVYIRRNKYHIKKKLLNTLNNVLIGSDIELKHSIVTLRKTVDSVTNGSHKEFFELFGQFLENADLETYILCSGKLKGELYESARLTLKSYDPTKEKLIKELKKVDEKSTDKKSENDPLEKSKHLISSMILTLLNALREDPKIETLKGLHELSKNDDDAKAFESQLEDCILEENADLFILCSGEIKKRVYELIRLTIKNWESNTVFTSVKFPEKQQRNNEEKEINR